MPGTGETRTYAPGSTTIETTDSQTWMTSSSEDHQHHQPLPNQIYPTTTHGTPESSTLAQADRSDQTSKTGQANKTGRTDPTKDNNNQGTQPLHMPNQRTIFCQTHHPRVHPLRSDTRQSIISHQRRKTQRHHQHQGRNCRPARQTRGQLRIHTSIRMATPQTDPRSQPVHQSPHRYLHIRDQ